MDFKIYGVTHTPNEQQKVYNDIIKQFCQKGVSDSMLVRQKMLRCNDIEELIKVAGQEAGNLLDEAVDIAVKKINNLGFSDYTSSQFNYEYSEFFDFDDLYQEYFLDDYGKILYAENTLKEHRQKQRDSREVGQFWGGGFGIKGMIKGALSAEILNMATEALYAIGDSIVDVNDEQKISGAKGEIVNNSAKIIEYCGALIYSFIYVGISLCHFLESNSMLSSQPFEFETAEKNYINVINSELPNDKKAEKLLENIALYPYITETYLSMFEFVDNKHKKEVYDLAKYYGFEGLISDRLEVKLFSQISELYNMPNKTFKQRNERYVKFLEILRINEFATEEYTWNEEYIENFGLSKAMNEVEKIYDVLSEEHRTFNGKVYDTYAEAEKAYEDYLEAQRIKKRNERIWGIVKKIIKWVVIITIIYFLGKSFFSTGIPQAFFKIFTDLGK